MTAPTAPASGRPLPSPFVAVVAYTLRACLPAKRWFGILLPCAGALLFGLLAQVNSSSNDGLADVAEGGLFHLILPLTCLIIGDAVLGADVRAGSFPLTWLSPLPFPVITIGRWLGGWLVALVTVVPSMALATVLAGVPDALVPIAVATAVGAAAYLALFIVIGIVVRRAAIWSLAIVLLGEWLLGATLTGIAQLSPLWMAQQAFAGLWDDGYLLERSGIPSGWGAVVRLAVLTVVMLLIATWRMRRMRPIGGDD